MTPEERKISAKIAAALNEGVAETLLRVLKEYPVENAYVFYNAFEDVLLANLKASFATISDPQGIKDIGQAFADEIIRFSKDLADKRATMLADPLFSVLSKVLKTPNIKDADDLLAGFNTKKTTELN